MADSAIIGPGQITGLVLAGGRGTRMGGVDKGLQPLGGQPLARHALTRLRQQRGDLIGAMAINANRHLEDYAALGAPVWPDTLPDFPGPLAGFLAGFGHCRSPWLLTVACDSPRFPLDLAQRLAQAFEGDAIDIAMATAPEADGTRDGICQPQPVFCLMRASLRDDLARFVGEGGRKTRQWARQHRLALVAFDQPGDDPLAFFNANTLGDLRMLDNA